MLPFVLATKAACWMMHRRFSRTVGQWYDHAFGMDFDVHPWTATGSYAQANAWTTVINCSASCVSRTRCIANVFPSTSACERDGVFCDEMFLEPYRHCMRQVSSSRCWRSGAKLVGERMETNKSSRCSPVLHGSFDYATTASCPLHLHRSLILVAGDCLPCIVFLLWCFSRKSVCASSIEAQATI